jgi:hypothetical protein
MRPVNKKKIILPTISVGLLITAREATADVIDFGVVAESLAVNGTIFGPTNTFAPPNTLGSYTVSALQFVGSHLDDVINGNTLSGILAADLGPQNSGTLSFHFPGNQGASGTIGFDGNYTLTTGGVTLTTNPLSGTLTSCTPSSLPALPGCLPSGGTQLPIDPYDAAGLITSLERAQILALPPGLSNSLTVTANQTITIDLGSAGGHNYLAEEVQTVVNTAAVQTPEPNSLPLTALGVAVLGWCRRLLSRRK